MTDAHRPHSPYKGLNAFDDSELDALFFFGRERECEIVVANLIASRLTVLYGPSGVGKSSLLRAAVARRLKALPEEPLVVVFSRWSENPAVALTEAVQEAVEGGAAESPVEALELAQAGRDVYLVLDQAEEYFLYHAGDAGPGSFAEALPAILSTPLRVNVLVSLREDSLAKLDRFTGRIPGLFANTLRLDRLDRTAARAAITRPLERYSELTGETVSAESELVERILDDVGAGQIEPALGGLGAVEGAAFLSGVEAPYLQLVLQRLWDEERTSGSDLIRGETFDRLGGAQHIVEEHLEGALGELSSEQKDVAGRLFNHLVTPSGTKISHDVTDLADFGEVPVEELQPVLDILSERRILRSLEERGHVRYEIFHDVLAEPVLAWRAGYEADRELERQKEAADQRQRRLLGVIAVGAVLFAAMGAVTLYALSQRSEVREQALRAHVQELQAQSDAELTRDPELSMLLALEAVGLAATDSSTEALRDALIESRAQQLVIVGEPLLVAKKSGRDVLAVTAEGDVVTAPGGSAGAMQRVSTGVPASDASFAEDGTALLAGRDGEARVVTRDGSVRAIPGVDDAKGAALSPDGSLAAIIDAAGVRLVDVESGLVLESYPHPEAMSAAISPDNRRVLTGGEDDEVNVWSGQSGRRVHTLTDHTGRPVALAFSPDGRYVASASADGSGRVWRTVDWGLQSTVGGHMLALTDVDFSTDGEHVVTSSVDGTARVLLTDSGTPLVLLTGSKGWVTSAAFTGPAGSSVVTASTDGTARVWDATFQPELEELAAVGAPVAFVEFADDGRLRAEAGDGRTHVLDADSGDEIEIERGIRSRRQVAGPSGATATIRGNTVVLRESGGRETVLVGHRDDVNSVSFSPDGRHVVTASRDKDVRIWDVGTGEVVGLPLQHNSEVRDARFSPDGRWIVSAAASRAALFDARDGSLVMRLQGHKGQFTSAAFDPSGRTIVTGGVDGTVRRYECEICEGLGTLVELAKRRLAATGRVMTAEERERYLG
jgi:WD40 repeat protein